MNEWSDLEQATPGPDDTVLVGEEPWHVLWTRSHCEQRVCDQLQGKGFTPFLPKVAQWSRRGGQRVLARVPMFPGYLFLRHAFDRRSYIEVRKATGLVRVLGDRWDHLAVVPDEEIGSVRQLIKAELPVLRHPYLREGRRVRITQGPLADVEGILLRHKSNKGLLVVSVNMLQRSVAAEVDCTHVVPV